MKVKPEQIDSLLPQTQCTLCGYQGCRPYAEAIVYKKESINKCLPGGVETLNQLGDLTGQDPSPFIEEMKVKQKPAMLAVIDESQCIGCKKCIQVCPVDAIMGAAKQMHSILVGECTGCELCIPACPVDCIEMIKIAEPTPEEKISNAEKAKTRYEFQKVRLERNKMEAAHKYRQMKFADEDNQAMKKAAKKKEIEAAVARVRERKNGC